MPGASKLSKKEAYDSKLCSYLDEYTRCFIVHADNVGSKQFMDIRRGLREHSAVLMGKNTMMKRSVRLYCERSGDDTWASIIPYLVGNVGLVFTKGDLNDVRDEIQKFQVGAPARVGLVAPTDVEVPAGNTGLDPSQTSFFQALNIPTKINRGTVEIVNDVKLITKGDKVGASEATLLAKLGIKPFSYGLVVQHVVDGGAIFDPKVLDITDEDLMKSVGQAINTVAAASLALHYPTLVAVPHLVINAFKNVLAVAVECETYSFPQADKVKEYLANPDAFAAAAPAADAGASAKAEEAAPAAKEEEEEESDDDMGFSLFD